MSSSIQYHKFPRGDSCTEEGCRSPKWYVQDGKRYCHRGHEQAGITETAQDEDDFNSQGASTRRKREKAAKVQIVFRGKEAAELYLECYQLILWKQCRWLVTAKGFPVELETVVRDLWGLRVRLMHADKEGDEGYTSTAGFSTTEEETDAVSISSRWSRRSKKGGRDRLPKLVETLGLCYLGTLLLRLPVSLGEFWRWAMEEEVVFSRAIMEIPLDMRRHLPAHFYSALEIRSPLKGSALHGAVMELVEFYHIQLEMVFPPLNFPLLIYKHMRDLALPIEIYPAVRRLATILSVDFKYPIEHKRNLGILAYPESQLMCLIVVATKLSQPFDDLVRHPVDDSDPTVLKINWRLWRQSMREKHVDGYRRGEEVMVTDANVFEMDGKKIDDYLDWYQRTWIDGRPDKMPEGILEPFPLQELPSLAHKPSDQDERIHRLKEVQSDMIIQESIPVKEGETVKRPGELYRRYRTVEELPDIAKSFYEIAARNIGMSLEALVRGVFLTEVKLDNWRVERRRRGLMEAQNDSSSDD